ncbi:MAG: hypothetical protein LBJ64_05420 [Deltaproteobacteria bacterium]|nr:hypothetical protein [Deltaproteobacteria bacterium]
MTDILDNFGDRTDSRFNSILLAVGGWGLRVLNMLPEDATGAHVRAAVGHSESDLSQAKADVKILMPGPKEASSIAVSRKTLKPTASSPFNDSSWAADLGQALSGKSLLFLTVKLDSPETRLALEKVLELVEERKDELLVFSFVFRTSPTSTDHNPLYRKISRLSCNVFNIRGPAGLNMHQRRAHDSDHLAAQAIAELVGGLTGFLMARHDISLDLADLRAILTNRGDITWGFGEASGPDRACQAFRRALTSCGLIKPALTEADRLAIMTTASPDLRLSEYEALNLNFVSLAGPKTEVFSGLSLLDDELDAVKIFFLATGFKNRKKTAGLPNWRISASGWRN